MSNHFKEIEHKGRNPDRVAAYKAAMKRELLLYRIRNTIAGLLYAIGDVFATDTWDDWDSLWTDEKGDRPTSL